MRRPWTGRFGPSFRQTRKRCPSRRRPYSLRSKRGRSPRREPDLPDVEGLDAERVVRVRVNQWFFRDLILAGYNSTCAVCGLGLSRLLVASHIVPWTMDRTLRMNPRNGLCLCGTHDRAYECGVLRVAGDYSIKIVVAALAKNKPAVHDWLVRYDGKQIQLPVRWLPDPVLLDRKLAIVSATAV